MFIKGHPQLDLKIVSRDALIRCLEKCQDTVWQGGKLAPTAAFDEVSKLLFCKLKDEKCVKSGSFYAFQAGTQESPYEVCKRIDSIYQRAKKEDKDVFKGDIRLEPKIVYAVVGHLQELAIHKIDPDTKGVAFEKFIQDFFRGKMGQFFTPRKLVDFNIKMLAPQLNDRILDPSCGSGGFLLSCLTHVRNYCEENFDENEAGDLWNAFAKNNLFGIEINDQVARMCKMNMILHGDGHSNIISTDALNFIKKIQKSNKQFAFNSFDIIPANPPFGATIKKSEKEEAYLEQFDLGKKRKTQKTEILFIERCIAFLKPGKGKIGIVLPDSISVNSSLQYVRDKIFEKTQILAIVSLPDFAFTHYGANVKSSLYFLRKLDENEFISDYPVFMAIAEKIGYNANGKEDESDLEIILSHYYAYIKSNYQVEINREYEKNIFVINSSQLKNRRFDPKGYTRHFRELKACFNNGRFPKFPLRDCIKSSISGEWGLDINIETVPTGFSLCYVLRNTNFHNYFNLDLSDIALRYIDNRKINALQLHKNDMLIEKSGGSPAQPVGRIAIIDKLPEDKPVIFSNFLQKAVVNADVIDPGYLYSYLKTLYHRGYMEFIQNQTTGIKNLLIDDFFDIEVLVPEKEKQLAIGRKYLNGILKAQKKVQEAYQGLTQSRTIVEQLINRS